jgi:hypothetical protein
VFGESIGNHITAIPAVPNLWALEIDPQAAAQAYRDRIVGPVRGVLPETVVNGIEEQLSGACTTEIAAFDEFTALLIDSTLTADYEHIIFDTAPTGHTIRLLQLPGAWSGFLEEGKGDASCLGPLAGLESSVPSTRPPLTPWPIRSAPAWFWSPALNAPPFGKWLAHTKSWPPSGCLNSTSLSMAFFQPGKPRTMSWLPRSINASKQPLRPCQTCSRRCLGIRLT